MRIAEIRPATRADLEAFYGHPPPITVHALVGMNARGEPVGIAGYYLSGEFAVAFTDFKEGLSKRDIVRGARALVDWVKTLDLDVVARGEFANVTPLEHFGFEPFGMFWKLRK